ncbi:hypothetical protein C8A01DRAFT_50752 [Parachaetomium inaequale]|uniref:Uncharacterized protein n=1 Tax=Parachaetomium inaequale TaxID=2588326 RepID=A0AAN6P8T7_9PEZI|nr:hypothetical protein C8A01DRAFT_50752 [Parachaetomium inaequale]
MPGYLQLLALTSVYTFKKEAINIAIYEVHTGRRKDVTNIFERPVYKSGIMKYRQPAYSVIQKEYIAKEVLEAEATEFDCPLDFVDIYIHLPEYPRLHLPAQKQNVSLAIRLANAYLGIYNDELSPDDIILGTSRDSHDWALDIFDSEVRLSHTFRELRRVLIFGHESVHNTRDLIATIIRSYEEHNSRFDLVILSPYKRYGISIHQSSSDSCNTLLGPLQPLISIANLTSVIKMAIEKWDQEVVYTLVTGSTYLVGEALGYLQTGLDGTSHDYSI